jgi:cytidine deaminase
MRQFEVVTKVTEYASADELAESDRNLLLQAREATVRAYAPYSQFRVGAALLLENGVVVTGNNQENVAYPSGLCAERVAIYAAGAQYPGVAVETLAVSCSSDLYAIAEPLSPCGACRQAMAEYETRYGKPIRIILGGLSGPVQIIDSVSSLLPLLFKADQLKKG